MGGPRAGAESVPSGRHRFQTTQWTLVLAAGGEEERAREALASLCRSYWHPVYSYLRARGIGRSQAEDLTQGFFARLIETGSLGRADPERGRFRSFLLGSLKNFLGHERERAVASKRGGGRPLLQLDTEIAERRLPASSSSTRTPEELYLQQWAYTVLERALSALGSEMRRKGQGETFELLSGLLTGGAEEVRSRDLAERLGTTEGAVRVRLHRMRRRFGKLLREEVAEIVATPDQVEDEIAVLIDAVGA